MKNYLKSHGVWLGLFGLSIVLTILTHGDFISPRNLTNLIRQASINGVLAAGMTMVILTGGIDLSIGSLVALCGILVGLSQALPVPVVMVIAVLSGAALGLVNGSLISAMRLAPFVITLGMMVIARGMALILSGGASLSPMSESLNEWVSGYLPSYLGLPLCFLLGLAFIGAVFIKKEKDKWLGAIFPGLSLIIFVVSFYLYKGLPNLVVFLIAVVLLTWLILEKTVLGRGIYAVGSNERAAYWAGVPLKKINILVYTMMGAFSGLAAFLLAGRLNAADPNAGQLFELDAIAAVVIGGTSLKGGTGNVLGSLVGALTMAVLNNGMDLLGVSSFYQMVFKGFIIILAVAMDRGQQRSI